MSSKCSQIPQTPLLMREKARRRGIYNPEVCLSEVLLRVAREVLEACLIT